MTQNTGRGYQCDGRGYQYDGVAILLQEHREYVEQLCDKGQSHQQMSLQLTEKLGRTVARGSIHYFFKRHPPLRKRWEKARLASRILERQEEHELEQKIRIAIAECASRDIPFRNMLAYVDAIPNTSISFGQLYRAYQMIEQGTQYAAAIQRKTGIGDVPLRNCLRFCKGTLPDGRTLANTRPLPLKELEAVLDSARTNGYRQTARILGYPYDKVRNLAKKHQVRSPASVGKPLLSKGLQKKVRECKTQGLLKKDTAKMLGISRNTVSKYWR